MENFTKIIATISFILAPSLACGGYDAFSIGNRIRIISSGDHMLNVCAGSRSPEIAQVVNEQFEALSGRGWLNAWPPPKVIDVCMVENLPTVLYPGVPRPLAGIMDPPITKGNYVVVVSAYYSPSASWDDLNPSHSWQLTLAHELFMAYAAQGMTPLPEKPRDPFELVSWEAMVVDSQLYQQHMDDMIGILSPGLGRPRTLMVGGNGGI